MTTTGTTWDNLKLSFAGATEMPRNNIAHELLGNIFFAHELHELTRRLCAKKNGDRVGRTNLHECNEGFIYMSCGVVPYRHAFSLYLFAHESHECNEGTGVLQNAPTLHLTPESIKAFILLWIEAAFTQNFTPKNYTYPSLAGITG